MLIYNDEEIILKLFLINDDEQLCILKKNNHFDIWNIKDNTIQFFTINDISLTKSFSFDQLSKKLFFVNGYLLKTLSFCTVNDSFLITSDSVYSVITKRKIEFNFNEKMYPIKHALKFENNIAIYGGNSLTIISNDNMNIIEINDLSNLVLLKDMLVVFTDKEINFYSYDLKKIGTLSMIHPISSISSTSNTILISYKNKLTLLDFDTEFEKFKKKLKYDYSISFIDIDELSLKILTFTLNKMVKNAVFGNDKNIYIHFEDNDLISFDENMKIICKNTKRCLKSHFSDLILIESKNNISIYDGNKFRDYGYHPLEFTERYFVFYKTQRKIDDFPFIIKDFAFEILQKLLNNPHDFYVFADIIKFHESNELINQIIHYSIQNNLLYNFVNLINNFEENKIKSLIENVNEHFQIVLINYGLDISNVFTKIAPKYRKSTLILSKSKYFIEQINKYHELIKEMDLDQISQEMIFANEWFRFIKFSKIFQINIPVIINQNQFNLKNMSFEIFLNLLIADSIKWYFNEEDYSYFNILGFSFINEGLYECASAIFCTQKDISKIIFIIQNDDSLEQVYQNYINKNPQKEVSKFIQNILTLIKVPC